MQATDTIEQMRIGAVFCGKTYTSGTWPINIAGRSVSVSVTLRPGYSSNDHLFDEKLALIHERLSAKPNWSSKHALERGIANAAYKSRCGAAWDMEVR